MTYLSHDLTWHAANGGWLRLLDQPAESIDKPAAAIVNKVLGLATFG